MATTTYHVDGYPLYGEKPTTTMTMAALSIGGGIYVYSDTTRHLGEVFKILLRQTIPPLERWFFIYFDDQRA